MRLGPCVRRAEDSATMCEPKPPQRDPEDTRKHLDFIQAIVTRMSAASSTAKAWLLPVVTAAYGYALTQNAESVALLGVGVTVSLAAGGFDLSIGSMAAFTQMAAAYILVVLHGSTPAAIAGCLAIGLLVGLFNGFLVVRLRIPDLLATLGVLFFLSGLELIPSGGRSIASSRASACAPSPTLSVA